MSEKATNITAHFLWPGLLISFLFGKREECRFYLRQCLLLNVVAVIISIIRILPLPAIEMITVMANFLLAICWSYSFLGAINGMEHNIPISEFSQILKDGEKRMKDHFDKVAMKHTHRNEYYYSTQADHRNHNTYNQKQNSNVFDEFAGSLAKGALWSAKGFCTIIMAGMSFALGVVSVLIGIQAVRMIISVFVGNALMIPVGIGILGGGFILFAVAVFMLIAAISLIKGIYSLNKKKNQQEVM